MVHLHTGVHMFVGFWMQNFQTGGLGEMVRQPGYHDRRINLKARITDAFATMTEYMLENTWRETDCRLEVLRATKGAHVEVY